MNDRELDQIRRIARQPLIELLREALDEIGSIHFFPSGIDRQSRLKNRIAEILLREDNVI